MTSDDDESINDYGIGFTNMVARTTPGQSDPFNFSLGCADKKIY